MTDEFYPLDAQQITPQLVEAMWAVLKKHGIEQSPLDRSAPFNEDEALIWQNAEDLLAVAAQAAHPIGQPGLAVGLINTLEEILERVG